MADPLRVTVAQIQAATALEFDLPIEVILSRRRWGYIIPARQVAMYLCHNLTRLSYPQLGAHFGRDHSTIHHGVAHVAALMAADLLFEARVTALQARIQGPRA